ncbi:histone [Burkholderia territorii]|uniref:Histone n=1 Tax=Burkholderia territorii TaxID=1503055 RepID=A0A108E5N0_9BURK|nr:H-NS histone family protein [Burkholderia territorii]KWN05137.1 histone [Burkholderia territorii]
MTKNIRELQQELGKLNQMIAEAKATEKTAILAQLKDQIEQYGITEREVMEALGFWKRKRSPAPAQYYDPDSGRSWSGQGNRPAWLADKDLELYRVDRAPKPWWPERDGRPLK